MENRIHWLLARLDAIEQRRFFLRPSPRIIQEDDMGLARIEANFDVAWARAAGYIIYPSYEAAETAARATYRNELRSVQELPSQFAGRVERFPSVVWTNDAALAAAHQKTVE